MMPNCRPGDIARIVRGPSRDRLVLVLGKWPTAGQWWLTEALQTLLEGNTRRAIPAGTQLWFDDLWLMPLRDQPGDDEMLRIAGKPQPKTFAEMIRQAIGEIANEPDFET